MQSTPAIRFRVLGLYPNRRGCAYAVLEGPSRLLAWGEFRLQQRDEDEFCRRLERLADRFLVHTIAFEAQNAKRSWRAEHLIRVAIRYFRDRDLASVRVGRQGVRAALHSSSAATRLEMVGQLIKLFPELVHFQPTKRLWGRDRRLDMFQAVALCVGVARGECRPTNFVA